MGVVADRPLLLMNTNGTFVVSSVLWLLCAARHPVGFGKMKELAERGYKRVYMCVVYVYYWLVKASDPGSSIINMRVQKRI